MFVVLFDLRVLLRVFPRKFPVQRGARDRNLLLKGDHLLSYDTLQGAVVFCRR